jgi:hypothetical protein
MLQNGAYKQGGTAENFQSSSPEGPANRGRRVGIPPWLPTRRCDAGRVDPLPPTAPSHHLLCGSLRLGWLAELTEDALQDAAVLEVADLIRGVEADSGLEARHL